LTTALQIINRAAELIGYKDPDESLSGSEAASFLAALNSMVDAWATDDLLVYAVTLLTQTVSGNPITIGAGATIDTARPVRLRSGGFFRIGGSDYGFQMVNREDYARNAQKALTAGWPRECYYEADAPTASLYFYPALSGSAELHLPIEQRLSEFAALATDYTLPPGYRKALEYSLAEELAPGRRPLEPTIARQAANARRAIRMVNLTVPQLDTELAPALPVSPLRPA